MTEQPFRLRNAPIIEAVLDVECDMPPKFALADIEPGATAVFKKHYPKARKQFVQEFKFETKENATPAHSVVQAMQALHFLQEDEKQLVQVRSAGFSFNRLAPYGSFDDYLSEIERVWREFVALTKPVQIRLVRLRFINRIMIPMAEKKVELDEYLQIGPKLPDPQKLTFLGFLNQHSVLEVASGHRANIVLTTQVIENGKLPLIFDISVEAHGKEDPSNWAYLAAKIGALRSLKNSIFRDTLTPKCLTLFQ